MLACHESQRAWLQKHHGMDNYIETMEQWTRDRGRLGGITYGEGFRQYRCHPYPQTPRLQELLGPLSEIPAEPDRRGPGLNQTSAYKKRLEVV